MLTYLSSVLSGTAEPFWPHVSLLSFSVLASIAVGAGIIFEGPKYPPSTHWVAFMLVVVGITIEALCTIFLFVFDEEISSAQQSKIIKLETRLAPRHLEQAAKLIARAKPFSGTKFAMSSGSSAETENFAIEIADASTTAGWPWVSWPLGTAASAPPRGRPLIGLDLMAGIETHVFDKSKEPAAIELFHGLPDAGFVSPSILQAPNPAVADVIIIIVGSKE
jgi:hypothetical protein